MGDRAKIVVAEDDEAILELLVTRLELAGYQTFVARDGFRALDAIYSTKPQGVVLDIGMPMMDGYDVLASLRANAKIKPVPVLVLTARNGVDDVKKAIALGAKDYLTKPFDDVRLLARVARLVRPRPLPSQTAPHVV
jgi:two-component system OmpR family response regulator